MKFKLLMLALLTTSLPSWGAVEMIPRYIYVLHGGVDAVWGQYMFMVKNTSSEELSETFQVVLPQETIDWQAQDGFSGDQFNLGSDGGLSFTKKFNPGDNIHTIGFKTEADSGEAQLTLNLPMDVNEISLMTASNLVLEGDNLQPSKKEPGEKYTKYFLFDAKKGDTIKLTVRGIAQGRAAYWRYGWIAAGIILVSCFGLAYWSRPPDQNESSS